MANLLATMNLLQTDADWQPKVDWAIGLLPDTALGKRVQRWVAGDGELDDPVAAPEAGRQGRMRM